MRRIGRQPKDWERFAVGDPSDNPKWTEPSCQPLRSIAHVAHVDTAIRIVEDRELRAGLINDKSKLKASRTQVVWLSPNNWRDGFRYGNVRLSFDWIPLVEDKKYYWVESIAYGVEACRILITNELHPELQEYDPESPRKGPWWKDADGEHYWNGNYCLEFMFEHNIDLKLAKSIDFVNHHALQCNSPRRCTYRNKLGAEAGAIFLGNLLGRNLDTSMPGFVETSEEMGAPGLSRQFKDAVDWLHILVARNRPEHWGSIRASDPVSSVLARSLAWHAARDDMESEALGIMGLFESKRHAWNAIVKTLAKDCEIEPTAFPHYELVPRPRGRRLAINATHSKSR